MFTDKELKKEFKHETNEIGKKSKWYSILDIINTKIYPDQDIAMYEKVLIDEFWTEEEKEVIKK